VIRIADRTVKNRFFIFIMVKGFSGMAVWRCGANYLYITD